MLRLTGGRKAGPGGTLLGLDPITDRGRLISNSAPTWRRASTLESPCSSTRFRHKPDRCPTRPSSTSPTPNTSPSPRPRPVPASSPRPLLAHRLSAGARKLDDRSTEQRGADRRPKCRSCSSLRPPTVRASPTNRLGGSDRSRPDDPDEPGELFLLTLDGNVDLAWATPRSAAATVIAYVAWPRTYWSRADCRSSCGSCATMAIAAARTGRGSCGVAESRRRVPGSARPRRSPRVIRLVGPVTILVRRDVAVERCCR